MRLHTGIWGQEALYWPIAFYCTSHLLCFLVARRSRQFSYHLEQRTREEDQKVARVLAFIFSLRSPVTPRTAAAERSWFDIAYSIPYYWKVAPSYVWCKLVRVVLWVLYPWRREKFCQRYGSALSVEKQFEWDREYVCISRRHLSIRQRMTGGLLFIYKEMHLNMILQLSPQIIARWETFYVNSHRP